MGLFFSLQKATSYEHNGISNHWELDCLVNSLFRLTFQKTSTALLPYTVQNFETFVLQWRHNERDAVSNHQRLHRLLNHLCGRRSKKTSKFRAPGLWAGNSLVTGEFPTQKASNAENVSIWWRHHWLTETGMGRRDLARFEFKETDFGSSVVVLSTSWWGIILRSTVRTSDIDWFSLPLLLRNGSQTDIGIGFAQKTASGKIITSILAANKCCQCTAGYVSFETN